MKQIFIIAIALLLLSCGDQAGSTSEVDIEIALSGTVTDTAKQGVSDVQLYLYSSGDDTWGDADTSLIDSTFSDTDGCYQFDSLPGGIYHIHANYEDSLFASKRNIIYTETTLNIDTLQLTGPGVITGSVDFDAENKQGVLLYIPGTSYNAYSDATGTFTLHDIPADSGYSVVAYLYGYSTNITKDITVNTLDTTKLAPITLSPNLYPSGVTAVFDSLSRTVTLNWNRLDRDDITGYLIFRKDSLLTALYPDQLNETLIKDTTFIDTLEERLFNSSDSITFEYRVKAQTKHDYTSFSEPSFIQAFIKRNPDDKKTLALEPLKKNLFNGTEEYTLHWEYTGLIDSVRIELTINGGDSWSEVTPPVKNRGYHTVKLPNTNVTGKGRFRISALNDTTLYVTSSYFSIEQIDIILIKNGDFSAGFQHWADFSHKNNPAEYLISHEEGKVRFDITKPGDVDYQIRFYQRNIPIIEGKRYQLSLEVKASNKFAVAIGLQADNNPWTSYFYRDFFADTTEQRISYEFTSLHTNMLSAFTIDLGGDTGTVWLDNISLELLE